MGAVEDCERLDRCPVWVEVTDVCWVEKFSETSVGVIVVYCYVWVPGVS